MVRKRSVCLILSLMLLVGCAARRNRIHLASIHEAPEPVPTTVKPLPQPETPQTENPRVDQPTVKPESAAPLPLPDEPRQIAKESAPDQPRPEFRSQPRPQRAKRSHRRVSAQPRNVDQRKAGPAPKETRDWGGGLALLALVPIGASALWIGGRAAARALTKK
jgi:outer membrane biosynthesis protein TonB